MSVGNCCKAARLSTCSTISTGSHVLRAMSAAKRSGWLNAMVYPALARSEHQQLVAIDVTTGLSGLQKIPQLLASLQNRMHIRRLATTRDNAIPAITSHAGTNRSLHRPLRADDQKASAHQMRCQSQQIQGIGTPAVQGQNRGVRSLSSRLVNGVEQFHGG